MKIKRSHQIILGVCLILLSMSHWFPFGFYYLELMGAFAHLTLLVSSVIAVVSGLLGLRVLSGFAIVSIAISGLLVIPHAVPTSMSESADFSVGQFNLYHHNPTPAKALKSIAESNVDLFSIQELNSGWKQSVDSSFIHSHPYRLEDYWEHCCYGLGLYSKYPIISAKKQYLDTIPYFDVVINVDDRNVRVICFHTKAPAFPNEISGRDRQLQVVAEMMSMNNNTIVFGDLNIVPWDNKFKEFLVKSGLTTVRNGFQATYPMDFGVPVIPIDHIAHNGYLKPSSCKTVFLPGSDHRGLVASFAFKE